MASRIKGSTIRNTQTALKVANRSLTAVPFGRALCE